MTGCETSGRALVLLLANKRQLFAFYHRAIDRDFGDIFAGNPHLHGADFDFEVIVIEAAYHLSIAAD